MSAYALTGLNETWYMLLGITNQEILKMKCEALTVQGAYDEEIESDQSRKFTDETSCSEKPDENATMM